MVLKIIAIVGSFLMSFLGYVYMWEAAKENKDENKRPILFFIMEYLNFFLSVTWIIIFCHFVGLY